MHLLFNNWCVFLSGKTGPFKCSTPFARKSLAFLLRPIKTWKVRAAHCITRCLHLVKKRRRQMQRDSGWKRISKQQQQEVAFNRSRHLDVKWKLYCLFPPAGDNATPLEPDFLRSGRIFAETADVEFHSRAPRFSWSWPETRRHRDLHYHYEGGLPFCVAIIIWGESKERELLRLGRTGTKIGT